MWKKEDDWFWEGNVQEKLAKHLENQGYKVTVTDTLSKSRGVDISAQKNLDKMLIEVKGYPSNKYVDGSKQGQDPRKDSHDRKGREGCREFQRDGDAAAGR